MALSGRIRGYSYDGHCSAWVEWNAVQDTINNGSTITATLYFNNDMDSSYEEPLEAPIIYIDGQRFEMHKLYPSYVSSGTWELGSISTTLTHNREGEKTFTLSFSYNCRWGVISGEESWQLNIIGNASTGSFETSQVNYGSSVKLNLSRRSDSFTHILNYSFDGSAYSPLVTGIAGESCTFTIPSEWMNQIPNAPSDTVYFTLDTYSGGTLLGTTYIGTLNILVPSNIVPTISSISCSDPEGYATKYGGYVQNKSKVKVTAAVSGSYSSTISTIKITVNGHEYSSNGCITDVLITAGTNTISVTATDSRGRTTTKTTTINVLVYTSPIITELLAFRCTSNGTASEDGAYMKVVYKALISALNNKNGKTFTLQYKKQSDSSYSTHTTYTDAYTWEGYAIIAADINEAYHVLLIAKDNFATTTNQADIATAYTLMDFNKSGHGIAFGKVSESNSFECALPADFSNGVIGSNVKTTSGADLDSERKQTWFRTLRDFNYGTLIETSIDYTVTSGSPFFLEIKGNSYGSGIPTHWMIQGYIYGGTIINHGFLCVSGSNMKPSEFYGLLYNGHLCFWFPRISYWQGFQVYCTDVKHGGSIDSSPNQVIAVTDSGRPSSNKLVDLLANIAIVITSKSIGSQSVNHANNADYASSSGSASSASSATSATYATYNPDGRVLVKSNTTSNNRIYIIRPADDWSYMHCNCTSNVGKEWTYGVSWWQSDERLKCNVKDSAESGLDFVDKLEHKEFDWDNSKTPREGHVPIGYIAQQVAEIDEGCVNRVQQTNKCDFEELLQIDETRLIPYLSKAIQELHGMVKKQQQEIRAIRKDIKNLKDNIQ